MMEDLDPNAIGALFDDLASANDAVERLVSAGIPRAKVQLLSGTAALAYADDRLSGFWAAITSFLFVDDDRRFILQGLRTGGCLLLLSNLDPDEDDVALDILDDDEYVKDPDEPNSPQR